MNIIYILVPLALSISALFLFFFIWAVGKGQYDDLDTSAQKILLEDISYKNSIKKENV